MAEDPSLPATPATPADTMPPDTMPAQLERQVIMAGAAARSWGDRAPRQRAIGLRAVADALDAAAEELIPLAEAETHLGRDRLSGEVRRTTFQLRLFADLLDRGEYLGAIIDEPDPAWGPGPRPDLRQVLVPLGPVVVFAASNFPFAFSVAGGDTASALAAGCPVVLKAHPGHPRLSARTGAIVGQALAAAEAPEGVFSVIYGDDAGRQAVTSPLIRAGAFTGSLAAGRALFDLAASRPDPIPFYAEMGSLNPVFVTTTAFAAGGAEILAGFATSFTLSAGQFCTKPGVLFVPAQAGLDEAIAEALVDHRSAAPLLNDHVHDGYVARLGVLQHHPALRTVVGGDQGADGVPTPTVLATTVAQLLGAGPEVLGECFGPASIVVTYENDDELLAAAAAFGGQLTAGVHGHEDDTVLPRLLDVLADRAGRVLWNGWPTGVSVTGAMHHGGPYPATTAPLHSSVGPSSIGRFLRPLCFQSWPDALLPPALRRDNPWSIPRTVNGRREEQ